jgi:hypothetical protein
MLRALPRVRLSAIVITRSLGIRVCQRGLVPRGSIDTPARKIGRHHLTAHLGTAPQETKLVLRLALRQRLYLGCKCYQFRRSTFFIQKAAWPVTGSCLTERRCDEGISSPCWA